MHWSQDKRNVQTSFTYDNLQRLSQAQVNSNNNSNYNQTNITYTYDAGDRATQLVDTGGGALRPRAIPRPSPTTCWTT